MKVKHDFYQATQQFKSIEWSDRPWCYVPLFHRTMNLPDPDPYNRKFNDEAQNWINDNLTEYGFNPTSGFMVFYSEDEALLFKLTWGEGCIW